MNVQSAINCEDPCLSEVDCMKQIATHTFNIQQQNIKSELTNINVNLQDILKYVQYAVRKQQGNELGFAITRTGPTVQTESRTTLTTSKPPIMDRNPNDNDLAVQRFNAQDFTERRG